MMDWYKIMHHNHRLSQQHHCTVLARYPLWYDITHWNKTHTN